MEQNSFKRLKILKYIQLAFAVLFFAVYFLLLFLTPSLRTNIFTNKSLLMICALLWIFMLYTFLMLLFDFRRIELSIASEHDLNRKAYLDTLTGIPNRYSCDLIFDTYKNATNISEIGCVLISISNLVEINETQGHDAGDQLLHDFSALLEKVADCYGFVGRNGGNEFIVVLENCTEGYVAQFLSAVEEEIKSCAMPVTIASAYVLNHYEQLEHFMDLVSLVYKKLLK